MRLAEREKPQSKEGGRRSRRFWRGNIREPTWILYDTKLAPNELPLWALCCPVSGNYLLAAIDNFVAEGKIHYSKKKPAKAIPFFKFPITLDWTVCWTELYQVHLIAGILASWLTAMNPIFVRAVYAMHDRYASYIFCICEKYFIWNLKCYPGDLISVGLADE